MFNDKLKSLRLNKRMKQSDLAKQLHIKNTTISNWEKGISKPDYDTICALCTIFDVDANYFFETSSKSLELSFDELEFIKKYRQLDDISQEIIQFVMNKEYERTTSSEDSIWIPDHYIDCYPRLASCGTGEYLFDSIPSEPIGVDKDCKADFAVGVNGDSMMPTYYDGQTLLIKKQDQIRIGEIGLFVIDGEAYIKELEKNKLISHNKNYPDILFNEMMNITCVGKVLGSYVIPQSHSMQKNTTV